MNVKKLPNSVAAIADNVGFLTKAHTITITITLSIIRAK
jgi:hypothetical protein